MAIEDNRSAIWSEGFVKLCSRWLPHMNIGQNDNAHECILGGLGQDGARACKAERLKIFYRENSQLYKHMLLESQAFRYTGQALMQ